ncbi:hypothetical protein [Rhodovulum imhoffii]|uniref:hypothetical protein n=1 Tax=Rhodovulum imhoffii TaxID=365340 RepID=UPI0011B21DFC|nr:hypothetical protein [Rhodovulum imhoffii]
MNETTLKLLRSGIIPIGLGQTDLERFYRTWVANHAMLRSACDRPVLNTNAFILNVTEPECPAILRKLAINDTPPAAWVRDFGGTLTSDRVPGDHYTAFSAPENAAAVARKFHAALAGEDLWTKAPRVAEMVA